MCITVNVNSPIGKKDVPPSQISVYISEPAPYTEDDLYNAVCEIKQVYPTTMVNVTMVTVTQTFTTQIIKTESSINAESVIHFKRSDNRRNLTCEVHWQHTAFTQQIDSLLDIHCKYR